MLIRSLVVASMLIASGCGASPATEPTATNAETSSAGNEGGARPLVDDGHDPHSLLEFHDRCEPDARPLAVAPGEIAAEATEEMAENGNSMEQVLRVATSDGQTTRGVRCIRQPVPSETHDDRVETTTGRVGDVDVIVVTEWAPSRASCEEGTCHDLAAIAWVLDRNLRLLGQLAADTAQSASIEGGVLVLGPRRRTVRAGQLALPADPEPRK